MSVLISIIVIICGFIIGGLFKFKTQVLRNNLHMVFITRKDVSPKQMIEMSSTAIILLYKRNLHKRNKATLKFWERRKEPKSFFYAHDLIHLENCIAYAENIKIAHVVLRFNDSSPALVAIGPMGIKRTQKLTSGYEKID